MSGKVTDLLGQPLPHALVELLNRRGQIVGKAISARDGTFAISCPTRGTYSLKLVLEGFKTALQTVTVPSARPISIALGSEGEIVLQVRERMLSGARPSASGQNDYGVSTRDIDNKPAGQTGSLAKVLVSMPGVSLDQNQEVHLRGQHNVGQYQVNGVLLPLDMYADPAFIDFIHPSIIQRLDLLTGILPAQYGFSNVGGIISIETKDGRDLHGGGVSLLVGQRDTLQPLIEYGGGNKRCSFYVSALYTQAATAFSSATPGPNPIHNRTWQTQGFGTFSYQINDRLKLSLIGAATQSANQLPDVAGLSPSFVLAGVPLYPSQKIDSRLDFRDYLGVLALDGSPSEKLHWQVAGCVHSLTQTFRPDVAGELIFQGVAAHTRDTNHDLTLQGDATYRWAHHTLGAGFYAGHYGIDTLDTSLVFPVDASGQQTRTTPVQIANNFKTHDWLYGAYLNDLWRISSQWSLNAGLRLDAISGFTNDSSIDPTINLVYRAGRDTTLHAGWARYMEAPRMQAFSPSAQASFLGTSNEQPPGRVNPFAQHDQIWDVGVVSMLTPRLSLGFDSYYEFNHHYSDEGQFGAVPIFVGFNYGHGYGWGTELSLKYQEGGFSAFGNLNVGRSHQYGVDSGQFNFDPQALSFIAQHGLILDHEPLVGVSGGMSWRTGPWNLSLEGVYSSGLRSGFANTVQLPSVVQFDLGVERSFGQVKNRLTVLNLLDRVNLIRPANGIGVFQAAYGPRFTVLDTLRIPLP